MATQEQIIRKVIDTLGESVEKFNKAMPGVQSAIADEVQLLMKDLELSGGNIKLSVANLKKIAAFRTKLQQLIKQTPYAAAVKEFVSNFDTIAKLHNQYFTEVSREFKPGKLLDEIKVQAIDSALESLTGAGLVTELIQPVSDMLLNNATSGASYTKSLNQLRNYINGAGSSLGAMQKHAKQITTDSLNQYSAQYSHAVVADLGLEWFMYTGALIASSRAFCEACVKKKYIHRSEIPALLKGDFKEFKDEGGKIDDKTGLPSGMIPGTNAQNFQVLRGGYNCGHQLVPVSAAVVPIDRIRAIPQSELGRDSLMVLKAA